MMRAMLLTCITLLSSGIAATAPAFGDGGAGAAAAAGTAIGKVSFWALPAVALGSCVQQLGVSRSIERCFSDLRVHSEQISEVIADLVVAGLNTGCEQLELVKKMQACMEVGNRAQENLGEIALINSRLRLWHGWMGLCPVIGTQSPVWMHLNGMLLQCRHAEESLIEALGCFTALHANLVDYITPCSQQPDVGAGPVSRTDSAKR